MEEAEQGLALPGVRRCPCTRPHAVTVHGTLLETGYDNPDNRHARIGGGKVHHRHVLHATLDKGIKYGKDVIKKVR
jgi:hypothetical protein